MKPTIFMQAKDEVFGSNLFIPLQEIVSIETKISESLYIYSLNTSQ